MLFRSQPALGTVNLQHDGRPTPLPAMPELGLHAPMYVAMSDDALAVSTGADEEKAMPQLLRSNDSEQPLLVIGRSEEHTSELQSLMRISYAVFCLKKKNKNQHISKNSITNIQ